MFLVVFFDGGVNLTFLSASLLPSMSITAQKPGGGNGLNYSHLNDVSKEKEPEATRENHQSLYLIKSLLS